MIGIVLPLNRYSSKFPPSTRTAAPLIADASGLLTNATTSPIFFGSIRIAISDVGRFSATNFFSASSLLRPRKTCPINSECGASGVKSLPSTTKVSTGRKQLFIARGRLLLRDFVPSGMTSALNELSAMEVVHCGFPHIRGYSP